MTFILLSTYRFLNVLMTGSMDSLGRFVAYFRAILLGTIATGAVGTVRAQTGSDELDWQAARAAGSIAAFEQYLQHHPLGRHASEAFIFVARMSVSPDWTPSTDEPALSPASRPGQSNDVADVY
ncbi:hypothetical protein N825_34050 [Skermanella stibiiresistens SB22]|uniref:Uncharacterized protein n=1 Tax=Skermanella stibiiresistens SB22 TaxID=1385369 RepID=W9GTS7_9PROT|nr:hypothetical protein [Skermanella stibiiresistens]EWY35837.1 hypothetical protein N825_34050 [Skermanella stibiiresistens SB22]